MVTNDNVKIGILGIVNSGINDLVSSINIEGVHFQNAIITLEEWIQF